MAKLINGIESRLEYKIDDRLKEYIHLTTTDQIPNDIAKALALCCWAISEQLEAEGELGNLPLANCVFTNDSKVTFQLDDEQLGMVMNLIVYPMNKWNKLMQQFSNQDIYYVAITEELVHLYWNIRDEVEVNFKVLEILKRISPTIKMSDIYNIEFMDNYNK